MNLQSSPTRLSTLQWRRIGASSTTLALHLLVGMVLFLPTRPPLSERLVRPEPTVVNVVDPPPKPPEPIHVAEPVVLHPRPRPRPRVEPAPQPPPVATTEPSAMSLPAAPTRDPGPAQASSRPGRSEGVGYAGSTRVAYPRDALRAHEQGKVVLHVLVGADGIPQRIEIEQSSGSARLDRAARDAVMHWHFSPALNNDVAEAAWALVPVSFNLSQE